MIHEDIRNTFSNTIFGYTREQAIQDGVLIDVSNMAEKAGFGIPVAVTYEVWNKYIKWTEEDSNKQPAQDQPGRLWDVLWVLYVSIASKRSSGDLSSLRYCLKVIPRDGHSKSATEITLKSVIGEGDEGEPVITIMLPNED